MSKRIDYIINNEKLINEWHWEKNNDLGLYPDKLALGSSKKAWWICENNHVWDAVIHSRNKGTGCPYCSGRLPMQGVNDLQTSNPILASEWNYAKNYPLLPTDVTKCSGKKFGGYVTKVMSGRPLYTVGQPVLAALFVQD